MRRRLNEGFTLVELMVVVAIIGLLSAVAVPNFKKYQAKAKTSEAKLQLSAIYMSMQSFSLDYNAYGTCLNQMGYDPSREFSSRYYAVGFAADNNTANTFISVDQGGPAGCKNGGSVFPDDSAVNMANSYFAYSPGKKVNNQVVPAGATSATWLAQADSGGSAANISVVGANFDTFKAGAIGIVSGDNILVTNADVWSINEKKELKNERAGY